MTILRAGGPEGPAASMVSAVLQRRMKRWWARSILSPSLISAFHLQCSAAAAPLKVEVEVEVEEQCMRTACVALRSIRQGGSIRRRGWRDHRWVPRGGPPEGLKALPGCGRSATPDIRSRAAICCPVPVHPLRLLQ